jgi:hypothetical protein
MRMAKAHAVAARGLAAVAAVVAGVGLWACLAAEARLWGPDAPVSGSRRWVSAPVLALPHVVGLVAALLARRSALCSGIVLVGAALITWLSYRVWAYDGLTRNGQVLALFQTWIIQVLLCSLPIGGAGTAWQERRGSQPAAEAVAGSGAG